MSVIFIRADPYGRYTAWIDVKLIRNQIYEHCEYFDNQTYTDLDKAKLSCNENEDCGMVLDGECGAKKLTLCSMKMKFSIQSGTNGVQTACMRSKGIF